ncbi:MAG: hypothetical protein KAY06_09575 [Aeromonadaceae bacterium]|nr:hypothetical protein [Aeromonadaceae bacterium]
MDPILGSASPEHQTNSSFQEDPGKYFGALPDAELSAKKVLIEANLPAIYVVSIEIRSDQIAESCQQVNVIFW